MARVLAAGFLVLLLASACGGSENDPGRRSELVVSAAASLTEAFRQIESEFETANPGVDVVLNLGGSSLLREQILSGAPVGVFASANVRIMEQVSDAGHLDGPYRVFALNRMTIAVPSGNPGAVDGLGDLADVELLLGLCAPTVPCGELARRVLTTAGVRPAVDTEEPNVRSLLAKVEAAELDAAVVYVTDLLASDGVDGIPIADRYNETAEYPIGVVSGSPDLDDARAFVAFVLSAEGRRVLDSHGFSLP